MIPLAIAIGIIEDKIANDLTGNKSTKEHLEELKEKFIHHKPKKYLVGIYFKDKGWQEYKVDDVKIENGFVMTNDNGHKLFRNNNLIETVKVVEE